MITNYIYDPLCKDYIQFKENGRFLLTYLNILRDYKINRFKLHENHPSQNKINTRNDFLKYIYLSCI